MTETTLTAPERALQRLSEGRLTLRSALRLEALQRLSVLVVLAWLPGKIEPCDDHQFSSSLTEMGECDRCDTPLGRAYRLCREAPVAPWLEVRLLKGWQRERLEDVWATTTS